MAVEAEETAPAPHTVESNAQDGLTQTLLPATVGTEVTPLLQGARPSPESESTDDDPRKASAEHLSNDTTWQREVKIIGRYTIPLIPTFLLQYSLLLATLISIGRLGTVELGAISVGFVSANISGTVVCAGLATSLDTLCPQAYGSGKRQLVGLHVQRLCCLLYICCIPIGVLWYSAPPILRAIIPEREVADLAGQYLRVAWFGLPGYATFSAGKRFLQAQGNFHASLYILMVVAPTNAFLNWFLVWHLGWGFIGAPIAFAISTHLLWICLVIYIYFVGGQECWPGFTRQALHGWAPMIKLALPGLIMVLAELVAFEIITVFSTYLGPTTLAANSVLTSTINLAFQIPFPMSTAVSTRVAHLIGAGSPNAAKVSAKVGITLAFIVGLINVAVLSALKDYIPRIFSNDPGVWVVAARTLPLCAFFLLFDAVVCNCNGILRGVARQAFGSWVSLLFYYTVGVPISIGTTFGAHWGLSGLWGGLMTALICVGGVEIFYISRLNWQRCVEAAAERNALH